MDDCDKQSVTYEVSAEKPMSPLELWKSISSLVKASRWVDHLNEEEGQGDECALLPISSPTQEDLGKKELRLKQKQSERLAAPIFVVDTRDKRVDQLIWEIDEEEETLKESIHIKHEAKDAHRHYSCPDSSSSIPRASSTIWISYTSDINRNFAYLSLRFEQS